MIEFFDIYKSYGKTPVIKGVSGKISESKVYALIGPSGSGKSTIIRILSLLDLPDKGEIKYEDNPIVSFPSKESNSFGSNFWPKITVVFQQLYLWPHLSVLDNISLALKSQEKLNQDTLEEIDGLLEKFELLELKKRFPNQLSAGQKQRVALVRALVLNPKYLFLDEITSSQDIEHIYKIKKVLIQVREKGTSIILATHLMGFAKDLADNIWFIDNGKIVEQGRVSLLENPKSNRLKQFLKLMD